MKTAVQYLSSMDEFTGEVARKIAVTTTRRRFLGLVVKGGVGLGMTAAGLGLSIRDVQAAYPCQVSPWCPSGCCNGWLFKCEGTCTNTSYLHTTCNTTTPGCWAADAGYGAWWYCCDCCGTNATGSSCTACGGGYKKCICLMRAGL